MINESGKSARIEQLIAAGQQRDGPRAQLTMDYCATLGSERSDKELTAFAREQLAEYTRQAGFYREQLAKLPDDGQADALRLACDHHFEIRLQVLFKVLQLFDASIDYEKLFRAAASGSENARAEVGEVLEGVLGQADAERIIGLAKPGAKPVRRPLPEVFRRDVSWARLALGGGRPVDGWWVPTGTPRTVILCGTVCGTARRSSARRRSRFFWPTSRAKRRSPRNVNFRPRTPARRSSAWPSANSAPFES